MVEPTSGWADPKTLLFRVKTISIALTATKEELQALSFLLVVVPFGD